jgi:hypothetical protein
MIVRGVGDSQGAGVLLIADLAVWPDHENLELFEAYRRSLGEARPLLEAPFHEFGTGDYVALECLLDLVLYFDWNASLIDAVNATVFHLSHEEWITVMAETSEPLNRWADTFADLGLKELG